MLEDNFTALIEPFKQYGIHIRSTRNGWVIDQYNELSIIGATFGFYLDFALCLEAASALIIPDSETPKEGGYPP